MASLRASGRLNPWWLATRGGIIGRTSSSQCTYETRRLLARGLHQHLLAGYQNLRNAIKNGEFRSPSIEQTLTVLDSISFAEVVIGTESRDEPSLCSYMDEVAQRSSAGKPFLLCLFVVWPVK